MSNLSRWYAQQNALASRPLAERRVRPVHFYHIGVFGEWERIAEEHFAVLSDAEFWGEVHVGVVGSPDQRQYVKQWLGKAWRGASIAAEADTGYEQVTLTALRTYAQALSPLTPVGYAHTKGAWNASYAQESWRRCMTKQCSSNWRNCVKLLEEYDTAGAHWLGEPWAHYSGTFWWATARYISTLPEPSMDSRYEAEAWIGKGNPNAFELLENFPKEHPHFEAPS